MTSDQVVDDDAMCNLLDMSKYDGRTDGQTSRRQHTDVSSADERAVSAETRNSAVADKPRDAFVQMQWRG